MPMIVLLGTLDTKGTEYAYVRERILEQGCEVILIDAGSRGDPLVTPDISRAAVASVAGIELSDFTSTAERGPAVEAMAQGAAQIVVNLYKEGRLHGILGLGGFGGQHPVTRLQ